MVTAILGGQSTTSSGGSALVSFPSEFGLIGLGSRKGSDGSFYKTKG
jgi:hypothetical protein